MQNESFVVSAEKQSNNNVTNTMNDNERQYKRQRKTMENNGKQWKTMENGQCRPTVKSHHDPGDDQFREAERRRCK